MSVWRWIAWTALLPIVISGCAGYPGTSLVSAGDDRGIAAKVNGKGITWDEVMKGLADRQYQLDLQSYQIKKSRIDELINDRLVEVAAAKEGLSPLNYLQKMFETKDVSVTDEQVHSFYEGRKAQLQGDESVWTDRIRNYLKQQRESEARREILGDLRKDASIRVFLQEPEQPRILVGTQDQPAKGSANAPVAIVEFSDFQCPYCSRAEETLDEVLKEYPDQVRLVYRDFPLTGIHPNAQMAAEAADCAYQLGKYWEYHDQLFKNQQRLSREDLGKYAVDVGMDPALFSSCLDGGKGKTGVEVDKRDGERLGVTGTPTFFVNGKKLSGALPIEEFKKVIDREIAAAKR